MINANARIMELASSMAKSSFMIPYTSHIDTFDNRIRMVHMERSPTDFEIQALNTCGTKVSDPVTTPSNPK